VGNIELALGKSEAIETGGHHEGANLHCVRHPGKSRFTSGSAVSSATAEINIASIPIPISHACHSECG
jgi:hypothetical protein